MSESLQGLLCQRGVLLFLIGLGIGVAVPLFRSPRIALGTHVATLEMGITLIALGLLGGHLALSELEARAIAHTLWLAFYLLTAGLLTGAAFGTGRILPIAGGGIAAKPWQELTAAALISMASLASIGAFVALLWLWEWR